MTDIETRWQDVQDTRPRGRAGEPREGSTGIAYIMWKNNHMERVRVLNRTRNTAEVKVQRMVPSGTIHPADLTALRSHQELLSHCREEYEGLVPDDVKKFDPTKFPNETLVKIWKETA